MDYEALVRRRICDPLDINNTCITLSAEMASRMATGHNAALHPYPHGICLLSLEPVRCARPQKIC